jgi:hypothetical protein
MKSILKISLFIFALITSVFTYAEELGRLFFTPQQRMQLDHNYLREERPDNIDQALILNGIVQKDGGKRTIWINGVPQQAGSSDEKKPESSAVLLPGQNKSVRLKVGQRVLLSPSAKPYTPTPNTSTSDTPKQ